jgi:putative redox protein
MRPPRTRVGEFPSTLVIPLSVVDAGHMPTARRETTMTRTNEITVTTLLNHTHRVSVGGHELIVDQPLAAGGMNTGPTPTELFVAGLASCIAEYAGLALRREHGETGVTVHCTYVLKEWAPARVTDVELNVEVPPGTPPARMAAVERAVEHCTVHNSMTIPPRIRIAVASAADVAA